MEHIMSTQSTSQRSNQNESSSKGTQGGSHEQHVKAGQQSHKNTSGSSSSNQGSNHSSGSGSGTSNRGFASMDPERQREIASEGGRHSHDNDKNRSSGNR
jgi:uncharacterized protein